MHLQQLCSPLKGYNDEPKRPTGDYPSGYMKVMWAIWQSLHTNESDTCIAITRALLANDLTFSKDCESELGELSWQSGLYNSQIIILQPTWLLEGHVFTVDTTVKVVCETWVPQVHLNLDLTWTVVSFCFSSIGNLNWKWRLYLILEGGPLLQSYVG